MKRILIATLALLLSASAVAQYYRPHYGRPAYTRQAALARHHSQEATYYGLRLGLGVATVNSDDLYLDGGTGKTGLGLGVVAGFQVAPSSPIFLETGLSYQEKGGKGNYGGQSFSYNLNYLEVPLVVKYHIGTDLSTSIQPFVGVYGALGVGGKIKDFAHRQAYSSFEDDAFKRADAGLRVGCGLQYEHLYAELGYDIGLANVSHDYFDTSHTGCFFANIGVNF